MLQPYRSTAANTSLLFKPLFTGGFNVKDFSYFRVNMYLCVDSFFLGYGYHPDGLREVNVICNFLSLYERFKASRASKVQNL
jgi:hypothetical protein